MNIFERMQKLDRRWIYIVVALAIIIPLMIPYNSDNVTTPPTENLYQMIDSFAGREDRAILMSFYHDAATMPELFPMEVAILRHCFERNVKVFTLTWFPAGAPIIDYAINTVKEEFPDIQSGVDYCNFGYKPQAFAMVLGMGDNIANTMNTDAEGRKLENLEIMRGINNYSEMNLAVEFSGSSAGGMWITYARPKYGLNVAVGVTAVMAADMYPYLQSGQLIGMLTGLKGAAEYEKLVDVFAAYRDPSRDYNIVKDEDGNPILPGRPFGREILEDESIKKLIRITTQTKAELSPEEYIAFSAKYPENRGLLNSLKKDVDGQVIIDVTQITPEMRTQMGETMYRELNRLTRNTLYKFKVARIGMNAQSVAHIMIIVFIILGNLGYFIQKYRKARNQ
ncbi:MAG: hypothetical protein RBR69_06745 [Candidatus Cloacimonadaceae bacterium]|jgi:hypothetical protein|nr:hypothetical protein [Candidatus Cloacimonadota bacterium]MDY0127808.1 hypothetical protein [Candidatus Cloacimonadaceae bacterium]MCB5254350.1 hypothetical protein [Candidatus Cloacimonadota bacterium]MCK9177937.1 hypothetical protein [Candidatus Cloacimonadota bacterium]MCK9242662.1 hypothetical protein [Candidatus Cloacimonadota bacterium]